MPRSVHRPGFTTNFLAPLPVQPVFSLSAGQAMRIYWLLTTGPCHCYPTVSKMITTTITRDRVVDTSIPDLSIS